MKKTFAIGIGGAAGRYLRKDFQPPWLASER